MNNLKIYLSKDILLITFFSFKFLALPTYSYE